MELRRYLRLKPYVGVIRRMDITPIQSARGRRDDSALRERIPALQEYEQLSAPLRAEITPLHQTYTTTISNDVHAASVEIAAFLELFCQISAPKKVADLGSGFSSFIVRRYAASVEPQPEVYSVDNHADWLEKTREYLRAQGVSADNVLIWDDFIAQAEPGTFDMVFHDMGFMDFRAETLEPVLGLTRPGGHIILDDVHKPAYRRFVHNMLDEKGLEFLSLKQITLDSRARYSYLVFT
jgi:predicted O-methyltransferase YrrM